MESSVMTRYAYLNETLSSYNFTINNISEDVKCIICHNLMINACQGLCGCTYCYKCINDYINTGAKSCPGNTSECKEENLSTVVIDHKINKKISLLTVKCPDEMCSYECQLKNMLDHLRTCFIDKVYCPFHEFGCDDNKLLNDQLHQHMINEMHNHSKMLVSEIGNIKNDMAEWKRSEVNYISEINDLKISGQLKDDRIKSLEEKLDSLKKENDESLLVASNTLVEQIEAVKELAERVSNQMNEGIVNSDERLHETISDFNVNMCIVKTELSDKLAKEITRIDKVHQKCVSDMKSQLDQWRTRVDKNLAGIFIWEINDIEEKRWSDKLVMSDFFYSKMTQYKMRLGFVSCGISIPIRLYVYPGPADRFLKWPCEVNVTMRITNDIFPVSNHLIEMVCEIPKPEPDSFSCSDEFSFSYHDLTVSGLMLSNSLVVECSTDFS